MNHPTTTAFVLLCALAATHPAAAQDFRPGDGFQVGGIYFYVVSTSPETGALFRVAQRLDSDGAEEHPGCYRVSSVFYHYEACPVLQAHFARYGQVDDSTPATMPVVTSDSGSGSHPIDYVNGNYVEPDDGDYWSDSWLYLYPWYGSYASPRGVDRGGRGGHGRYPGSGHRGPGTGGGLFFVHW